MGGVESPLGARHGDRSSLGPLAEGRLEEGLAQLRSLPAEVEERPLFIAPRELLEADYLGLPGREAEARAASRRAAELLPLHRDAYWGQLVLMQRAYVSSALREADEAVTLLERLLEIPSFHSPAWLPLDPYLKPLHGHPRFVRLTRPDAAAVASAMHGQDRSSGFP